MLADEAMLREIRTFQNKNRDLGELLNKSNLTSFELDEIMGVK